MTPVLRDFSSSLSFVKLTLVLTSLLLAQPEEASMIDMLLYMSLCSSPIPKMYMHNYTEINVLCRILIIAKVLQKQQDD